MAKEKKKKRTDWWDWPTGILLVLVIGLIGYQFFQTLMARNRLINELIEIKRMDRESPESAEIKLNELRIRIVRQKNTYPERILSLVGLPFPDISENFAEIYRKIGDKHAKRYDHVPLIRYYTLCLLHEPMSKNVALDLGASCMKTGNTELGYYAGILHAKENKGHSVFIQYFQKYYQPTWEAPKTP